MILRGRAVSYNNRDTASDIILPGAVCESSFKALPVLWNHEGGSPVGVVRKFFDTPEGMDVEFELCDTFSKHEEILRMLGMGIELGLSIGYQVRESVYDPVEFVRRIHKLHLIEISIVLFPCNNLCKVYTNGSMQNPPVQLQATVSK